MDRIAALFHQSPIVFVAVCAAVTVFVWGALGTAQRRRNLRQAFGSPGFSALEAIGSRRMEELLSDFEPVIGQLKNLQRKCRLLTVFLFVVVFGIWICDGWITNHVMAGGIFFVSLALVLLPNVFYVYHINKKYTPLIARQMGFDYEGKNGNVFQMLLASEQKIRSMYGGMFGSTRSSILLGDYEQFEVKNGFSHPLMCFEKIHTWVGKEDKNDESLQDTKFKGLLVRINMPKPFETPILLREDMGHIGNKFSFAPKGFETIGLEDPEFESFFEVFAPNQIKARRILTPRFMQTIKTVVNYYPGGRVTALMADKNLYLAIFTHENLFGMTGILTALESRRSAHGLVAQFELQKRVLHCLTSGC